MTQISKDTRETAMQVLNYFGFTILQEKGTTLYGVMGQMPNAPEPVFQPVATLHDFITNGNNRLVSICELIASANAVALQIVFDLGYIDGIPYYVYGVDWVRHRGHEQPDDVLATVRHTNLPIALLYALKQLSEAFKKENPIPACASNLT